MNQTVSEPQLLQALQWRYATKAFDPNQKIPVATWGTLQEALVLSASSFGLQPYRSADDKYSTTPKVRFPAKELIQIV